MKIIIKKYMNPIIKSQEYTPQTNGFMSHFIMKKILVLLEVIIKMYKRKKISKYLFNNFK
ncbi:hypothetical protein RB653_007461 [Dictyostelium firmibasis]|uniref:Uncharacterized protein n=1 Tax=Dictyostelium firmibasis TaxID=79012 RepID=A0AAN7YXL7_9MYCE